MTGPVGIAPAAQTAPTHQEPITIRSTEMLLLHEELARAHMAQRLHEAQQRQRAHRLVAAHRAVRRAEQASLRARRLLAAAVAG